MPSATRSGTAIGSSPPPARLGPHPSRGWAFRRVSTRTDRLNGLQIYTLLRAVLPGVEIHYSMEPVQGIATMGILATRAGREARATLQSGKRADVLALAEVLRNALA
jgi:hypothetical protein